MAEVRCYGGVNEIGGNKILIDLEGTSVFLDFGYGFGSEAEYYEEFLQPRSATKLHDLLALGLTPRLDGVYRQDALEPPGLGEVVDDRVQGLWRTGVQSYETAEAAGEWTPDAVVLSHAHLDHAGYLPYLGDVPVVCSPTTRSVLEAIVDVGNLTGFDAELVERKPRSYGRSSSRAYFPGAPKVERDDEHPRTYRTTTAETTVGRDDVQIEVFDVGHSIPGAHAALLESSDTQIVYTGDLRFHGRSGYDLRKQLHGLRPDVLLCEGTRIDDDEPDDEQRVEDEMTEAIASTQGLAMVGFAWKDLERYETLLEAADRTDRIPVVDPRLAYLTARLDRDVYADGASVFVERSDSMTYSPADYTRSKHRAGTLPVGEWSSGEGVSDTTHLEQGTTALDVRDDPTRYVLHLDYFRFKNLPDLDPPAGSTYIRAQTEPFNDEMVISEDRLRNWLAHYDINAANNHAPLQIHASGHASGPELQSLVNALEPGLLIPIHTEHPELFTNPYGDIVTPKQAQPIPLH